MADWLETYRGIVYRWEVDPNDHLTVAYYFARIADAGQGLLGALGLAPTATRTVDCFVRYQRELRVGDIMHVESGVIGVEDDTLALGHKVFDSGAATLCTTVEQRVRLATAPSEETQRRIRERRVAWDGPARERRPRPRNLAGLRDTGRDLVEPVEVDLSGGAALAHYIHRFSGANGHAIAAFGMTPAYMRAERRGFSTFEFQLEVAGPLRPGDVARVRSGVLHVGNSSLRLLHVMSREPGGEVVATLEQSGVHFDQDARRPVPLPESLRDRAHAMLLRDS
ncbi:MAG TPA: thioesterase family protein [Candidatus Dormibacteraeota bacterium]|nr:thioesterase family protein [Candidatus Dormibacteraeota bacterium]